MKNYKVQDNINFYSELTKSLKEEDENLENICLITNTPLQEHNIKLECGHSFNYLSIYKDINNHKNKFNLMELSSSTLKAEQIRCPYCRNIQNKLLPYIEIEGVEKIHGVNYFDENYSKYNCYFQGECCFLYPSPTFDPQIENSASFIQCSENSVIKLKENGKDYCSHHKLIAYKELIKEAKLKAKLLEKEAKMKDKLLEKEAKLKAKLLEKEAKLLEKSAKLNNKIVKLMEDKSKKENIVLCSAVFKSGKNKGLPCCFKVFENDKCKKHTIKI
jgi:hypothetical protein